MRYALAVILMLLAVSSLSAQEIGVRTEWMEFDKKLTDCKFQLAVQNDGGPAVHEYRVFFYVVAGGQNAKLCEQRLGHPKPKYHEHCSNVTKIRCEDVQLITLIEMQCLDDKGKQLDCRNLMAAEATLLTVELADPPFALEKD